MRTLGVPLAHLGLLSALLWDHEFMPTHAVIWIDHQEARIKRGKLAAFGQRDIEDGAHDAEE